MHTNYIINIFGNVSYHDRAFVPKFQIVIEPQIVCSASYSGKSIVPMDANEREEYEAAVRQIEKRGVQAAEPAEGNIVEAKKPE